MKLGDRYNDYNYNVAPVSNTDGWPYKKCPNCGRRIFFIRKKQLICHNCHELVCWDDKEQFIHDLNKVKKERRRIKNGNTR